jgi:hypothetical protein
MLKASWKTWIDIEVMVVPDFSDVTHFHLWKCLSILINLVILNFTINFTKKPNNEKEQNEKQNQHLIVLLSHRFIFKIWIKGLISLGRKS